MSGYYRWINLYERGTLSKQFYDSKGQNLNRQVRELLLQAFLIEF